VLAKQREPWPPSRKGSQIAEEYVDLPQMRSEIDRSRVLASTRDVLVEPFHEPLWKRGAESFTGVRQALFAHCADGPVASDSEEPLDFRRAQRPRQQMYVIQPDQSLVPVMVSHAVDAGDGERVHGVDCTNGWTERGKRHGCFGEFFE
jgi:hypothetical protein